MQRKLASFDWVTLFTALVLGGAGAMCIFGSTAGIPGRSGLHQTQMAWLAFGVIAFAVAATVDYHVWSDLAPLLYGLSLASLAAVLVVSPRIANTHSWFVVGPVRFQPSEAAKVAVILMLGWFLSRRSGSKLGLSGLASLGIIVGVPVALIALQPDTGTCLTYMPLFAAGVFLGGIRWRTLFVLALAAALVAPLGWAYGLKGYQKERILTVIHPDRDPAGVGYQVRQSRIAIGSGELWGKGLKAGTQSRLQFLPQQHTDFVFSALAEQWGFVGSASVLGLYFYMVMRAFSTGRKARDRLGLFLAVLTGSVIGFQALINLGMALGALPTIGVPLPLLSYGGSSILATMTALGLLANVRTRRFVN